MVAKNVTHSVSKVKEQFCLFLTTYAIYPACYEQKIKEYLLLNYFNSKQELTSRRMPSVCVCAGSAKKAKRLHSLLCTVQNATSAFMMVFLKIIDFFQKKKYIVGILRIPIYFCQKILLHCFRAMTTASLLQRSRIYVRIYQFRFERKRPN